MWFDDVVQSQTLALKNWEEWHQVYKIESPSTNQQYINWTRKQGSYASGNLQVSSYKIVLQALTQQSMDGR